VMYPAVAVKRSALPPMVIVCSVDTGFGHAVFGAEALPGPLAGRSMLEAVDSRADAGLPAQARTAMAVRPASRRTFLTEKRLLAERRTAAFEWGIETSFCEPAAGKGRPDHLQQ
jgi:hypothetical protein